MRIIIDFSGIIIFLISVIVAIFSAYFWAHDLEITFALVSIALFFILYFGSLILIFNRIKNFNVLTESLNRLILLYFETLLIFAAIYLWLQILSNGLHFQGFHRLNLENLIDENKDKFIFKNYVKDISKLIFDTVHFSIVTSTTLGYGDMIPKTTLAKIIVDIQVLYSVGIVIIGFGKYMQKTK